MVIATKLASTADEKLIQYVEFYAVDSVTLDERHSVRFIVDGKNTDRVSEFLYLFLLEDSKNSVYAPMARDFVKQFDEFMVQFDKKWKSVAIHD